MQATLKVAYSIFLYYAMNISLYNCKIWSATESIGFASDLICVSERDIHPNKAASKMWVKGTARIPNLMKTGLHVSPFPLHGYLSVVKSSFYGFYLWCQSCQTKKSLFYIYNL